MRRKENIVVFLLLMENKINHFGVREAMAVEQGWTVGLFFVQGRAGAACFSWRATILAVQRKARANKNKSERPVDALAEKHQLPTY